MIADESGSEAGYSAEASGLDVLGAGTVQLGNVNTYTGETVVGDPNLDVGSGNGTLEIVAGGGINPLSEVVLYNGATLKLDSGAFLGSTIDLSHVTTGVNLIFEPGADFLGNFVGLPSTLDMPGVAWTHDLGATYIDDDLTLLLSKSNGAGGSTLSIEKGAWGTLTSYDVADADDIQIALNSFIAGESAGTISGSNLTLTPATSANLRAAGLTDAGDVYLPDLAVDSKLGRAPSIIIQGDGGDDAYGRGFIHLAASDGPLVLDANGGTLAITSDISDQIAGLAGFLPGAAAIVSGATPAANQAGANYTTRINFNAVDDFGNTLALTAYFTKTAADTWEVTLFQNTGGSFPYASVLATTTLAWNGSSFSGDPLVATLASGDDLRVDLSGLTQINGSVSGELNDVTPVIGGAIAGANLARSAYGLKYTIVVNDDAGAARTVNLYFTRTAANTWQVAAYDASTAASGGGFPYSGGPLGVETLTFADGAVSSGGHFALSGASGHDLVLNLSGLTQGNASNLSFSAVTASTLSQTTASALGSSGPESGGGRRRHGEVGRPRRLRRRRRDQDRHDAGTWRLRQFRGLGNRRPTVFSGRDPRRRRRGDHARRLRLADRRGQLRGDCL